MSEPRPQDDRVLILAPTGRDAEVACEILIGRANVPCESCGTVEDLCTQMHIGTGAVVLAAGVLNAASTRCLTEAIARHPAWSDVPLIVLSGQTEAESVSAPLEMLRQRGNVTVLDRPVRIVTLVSAVQSALRARHRQYEVRDLLMQTRTALSQRDQFLAMLGHELRNPLATITTAMSVVDAAAPSSDALELEQRGIIRRQTGHLARLVDDLLDVSRITSGKITLRKKPVDLAKLVRDAIAAVDGGAREQRHEISIATTDDTVMTEADPVRLEQVVNNLLTNAIKYTPAGGKIAVSVESKDGRAIVRVRDNGIGISAELLPRVFDLFAQADRSLDRSQGGMGIGLTLVRSLIELHGGNVTASSAGPGHGSEFTVNLPLAKTARTVEPARTAPEPVGRGQHILVVEDNRDARRALQVLLQFWGYKVDVAEDGPSGVETALRVKPEIAFIDVGLPGLDGYQVAQQIRAAVGNDMRLIALTGYGQPEDREKSHEAGFDLHLVKPIDANHLAKSLQNNAEVKMQNAE